MSSLSVPEEIPPLPEMAQGDSVNLNEESNENFTEFEDPSNIDADEFSECSILSVSTIERYKTIEISRHETEPDDALKAVPPEHYPDMLFLMEDDFPRSIHAYEYIRSLIKWKKIYPQRNVYILAPEGNYKNGLFFFCTYKDNFYGSAYCYKKTDISIMEEALVNSRYKPVKDQYYLCRINVLNLHTFEAVKHIFSDSIWCCSKEVVLWLPWYCARQMEVHLPNEDFEIRTLGLEHVDLINESWQENFPGSRELLGDLFDIQNGLGLFADNSLLSWALLWYHGGIGIIQTIETEKGKGYCRPVIEALTKRMGECLTDVHLKINMRRKRDILFFSALGFRYGYNATTYEAKKNHQKEK